jgi:hypothetical protein
LDPLGEYAMCEALSDLKTNLSNILLIINVIAALVSIYYHTYKKSNDLRPVIWLKIFPQKPLSNIIISPQAENLFYTFQHYWRRLNIKTVPSYYWLRIKNIGNISVFNVKIKVKMKISKNENLKRIFITKAKIQFHQNISDELEPGKEIVLPIVNLGSFADCSISCLVTATREDRKIFKNINRKIKYEYSNPLISKNHTDKQLSLIDPNYSFVIESEGEHDA